MRPARHALITLVPDRPYDKLSSYSSGLQVLPVRPQWRIFWVEAYTDRIHFDGEITTQHDVQHLSLTALLSFETFFETEISVGTRASSRLWLDASFGRRAIVSANR